MVTVKFKNLDKSAMAEDLVRERIETLVLKFEDLQKSRILVTLEMQNSPLQAGPDLFIVKLNIFSGRFDGLTLSKSDSNLYVALAKISEHMLEKLNRTGDRQRVKSIKKARTINRGLKRPLAEYSESQD
jgi:ribosome-associated translation inhibitor RaiA